MLPYLDTQNILSRIRLYTLIRCCLFRISFIFNFLKSWILCSQHAAPVGPNLHAFQEFKENSVTNVENVFLREVQRKWFLLLKLSLLPFTLHELQVTFPQLPHLIQKRMWSHFLPYLFWAPARRMISIHWMVWGWPSNKNFLRLKWNKLYKNKITPMLCRKNYWIPKPYKLILNSLQLYIYHAYVHMTRLKQF